MQSSLRSILVALSLSACAPVVTSVPMQVEGEGTNVTMTIVEDGSGAKATAYLEGRVYQGRLVQESHQESTPVQEVEIVKNADGSESQVVTQRYETQTVYDSAAHGLLLSSNGDALRCEFTLAYPEWGFSQGGLADCRLTDGRSIIASF